jgi:hypothetical protein
MERLLSNAFSLYKGRGERLGDVTIGALADKIETG